MVFVRDGFLIFPNRVLSTCSVTWVLKKSVPVRNAFWDNDCSFSIDDIDC